MRIIRKINNSAAVARDSNGKEIVILGKGLGFPDVPYELEDLSRIERSFYDVDPRYLDMIGSLQREVLLASAEIAEEAEIQLNAQLNPNLPLTLADHMQFAMERISKGTEIATPIAYDVKHLYPREYDLGKKALDIFENNVGVRMPEIEAVNVALHLINAQSESGNARFTMRTFQIIGEIDDIVEQQLNITLNKESYSYSRFAMHLQYLIQRLASGRPTDNLGSSMLKPMAREYPEIFYCARQITKYLESTYSWRCNDEETLYLMMHINRAKEKAE